LELEGDSNVQKLIPERTLYQNEATSSFLAPEKLINKRYECASVSNSQSTRVDMGGV
jgi:hypothetical protein